MGREKGGSVRLGGGGRRGGWGGSLAVHSDGLVPRLALDSLQLIDHVDHGLGSGGRGSAGPLGVVELSHNATLMCLERGRGRRRRGRGRGNEESSASMCSVCDLLCPTLSTGESFSFLVEYSPRSLTSEDSSTWNMPNTSGCPTSSGQYLTLISW